MHGWWDYESIEAFPFENVEKEIMKFFSLKNIICFSSILDSNIILISRK